MAKASGLIEALSGGLKKALDSNIGPSEEIAVSLQGLRGEALVATDRKVYVLKAGYSSGAMFGGKCKAFPYGHISSVEFSCGLTQGRVQITAAGSVEQRGHSGKGALDAWADAHQAENVVNFHKGRKALFQEAANLIRERVDAAHNQPAVTAAVAVDEAEQIRKLKGLVEDGIITQEEFEAKKRQILGL